MLSRLAIFFKLVKTCRTGLEKLMAFFGHGRMQFFAKMNGLDWIQHVKLDFTYVRKFLHSNDDAPKNNIKNSNVGGRKIGGSLA